MIDTLEAQLLVTSMLDERWTNVYINSSNGELKFWRDGGDMVATSNKQKIATKGQNRGSISRTQIFSIQIYNLIGIVKDSDNLTIQFNCKSNNYSNLGYALLKLNSIDNYNRFIKSLQNLKNIEWSNRTLDLDKRENKI